MVARAAVALVAVALLAPAVARSKPAATIVVDVSPHSGELDVEKRYTPELMLQLHNVKSEALLLYTEYCSKAAADLKNFSKNVTALVGSTLQNVEGTLRIANSECRQVFQSRVRKIEADAHKAATFSTENHHKFLLGHMIVFRMHLNKSEDYIRKCEWTLNNCGMRCETTSRVLRLRRLALNEIQRVQDDIEHSRRSYKDIIIHACRKLNHLRKHVIARLQVAVGKLETCAQGYQNDAHE